MSDHQVSTSLLSSKKEAMRSTVRHKAQPKLQMVANGSITVNTLRAERACAVSVPSKELLKQVPCLREARSRPRTEPAARAARGKFDGVSGEVHASVFIQLVEGTKRLPEVVARIASGRRQDTITATMPLDHLDEVLGQPEVVSVELGERIVFSPPTEVRTLDEAREVVDRYRRRAAEALPDTHGRVLVGIVDVQGFDFSHPDFLDNEGQTRFEAIWDQGGDTREPPMGRDYGAEIRREHLDAALAGALVSGLPASLLEPQSQMAPSSHATHVASIAAGESGVCPKAVLAGVLVQLPQEDRDRRKSFYDSTRIAHAVEYLFGLANDLELPVVVNVSLGTNGHAHDASSGISRWIDHALAVPGRAVCVAAGNAGQEAPVEPGDWGYMMGRIHTSGRIAASGLKQDIEWIVVGDGIADLSENELEIWYPAQDRLDVWLRTPAPENEWIGPIAPGEFIENRKLDNGTFVSIYSDRFAPANGANSISIYLSPFFSDAGVVGVAGGTWIVRLEGREVRDGSFHGWIERDDPRRLGRVGLQEGWSWPSFFSRGSAVDEATVSSLACGQRVVSVANLDASKEVVHVTSSQGPTRDNREKPEIAAPGTAVVAANGFDPEQRWVAMTGTSMSCPFVTGTVAMMLMVEPQLTAAQIGGILRRTAEPLPGKDFRWHDDAGYGRIDPAAAVLDALSINERRDLG